MPNVKRQSKQAGGSKSTEEGECADRAAPRYCLECDRQLDPSGRCQNQQCKLYEQPQG